MAGFPWQYALMILFVRNRHQTHRFADFEFKVLWHAFLFLMTLQHHIPQCDLAAISATLAQMSFYIEKEAQVQLNSDGKACKGFLSNRIQSSFLNVSQSIENANNGVDDSFTKTLTSSLEKLYGQLCTESAEFMANASLQVASNR
jgi:hypothetical protein